MGDFIKLLLLNNEPQQFGVLLFYGYIGAVLSYLFQVFKYYPRINKEGGFSAYYAAADNKFRILGVIIVIPLGVLFSKELLGVELTPFTSLLSGLASDKTMDALSNRKK